MTTVEVRSLLDDGKSVRVVRVEEHFVEIFKIWQLKFIEKTGREPNMMDVFYAGNILSNPNVREKFRIYKEKQTSIN